ncbi:MAG: ATP-binding protein [Vicinamibacterales bacterium]
MTFELDHGDDQPASGQAWNDIVEQMPIAVQTARLDADGDFTLIRANRAVDAVVGFELSARVGHRLSAIFPNASPERFARYRDVALGGDGFVEPLRVYEDDHIKGAFDLHAFRSGPNEVTVVYLNATDRLRKEELQQRYRQLLDDAPDMMAAVSPATGIIRECNQTLVSELGYAMGDLVGRHVVDIHHPSCRDEVARALATLGTLGEVPPTDLLLSARDGRVVDVSLKASAIRNAAGDVTRSNWVWRDVTSQKRAEAELRHLEQKNTDLARFAYIASHDLQEPLRAIINFSGLLAQELQVHDLSPSAVTYLRFVTDGATRMQGLISGLLEYSRLSHRREPRRVDCAEVCRDVVAELQGAIQLTGAEVRVQALPILTADPVELSLVLRNLISNALKFVRPQHAPRVTVGVRRSDEQVVLWVADEGVGLSEDDEQRIFEMFRRLHPRSEYPGNGVGLALCRRVAELNGGRIWVERNDGPGATFCVGLPLPMLHEEDGGPWS